MKKLKHHEMWTATGTLFYCAPEVYEGGGYTYKIDIWAVGVSGFIAYFIYKGYFVSVHDVSAAFSR
jgi:serine/threonine protein kinase